MKKLSPFPLLDDPKIEQFIDNWHDNRVPDKAEAQRRKDRLRQALLANNWLRESVQF